MKKWIFRLSVIIAIIILAGLPVALCEAVGYDAVRQKNSGQLAERLRYIPTTEQAVIFTFGGLTRESSVDDILQRMDAEEMKGTFFVSERELLRNTSAVDKIAARGHELGIGIRTSAKLDFNGVCAEIERIQQIVQQRYGVKPRFVRQMSGPESAELREAVSAMDCVLIGQTISAVQSRDRMASSAGEIMPKLFGKWALALGRGQIVYIRTDFYNNDRLAGDVMMAIKHQKVDNAAYSTYEDCPKMNPDNNSAYSVKNIGAVYDNKQYRYTYPANLADIPEELWPGQVKVKLTKDNFKNEFYKRYIGAPLVDANDRAYGFSRSEAAGLDQSGVIKGVSDNTIFLTFDDWSSDLSVNHLLYVLRKHKVKGTFFIITWNTVNNINLLRSIAAEGHEIGSHTDRHISMGNYDAKKRLPDERTQSPEAYAQDVASSYDKLAGAVGDVAVDGRHSLTRLFRPPTLAISKSGVKGIFEAGFTHIVSGYESTKDYAAPDRQAMIAGLQHGIYDRNGHVRKGSIIIMHMSDTAKFTAESLDILLTFNEQLADSDPRKFKVGLLGDYLKDGYSQKNK